MSADARGRTTLKLVNAVFEGDRWRPRENNAWLALVLGLDNGTVKVELTNGNNVYETTYEMEEFREKYYKL